MDISRMLGLISEARWLIGAITAGFVLVALAYALLRIPVYRANTVVQVLTQQSGGLSGVEQFSALLQGSALPTETEIQLLQSRAVLMSVIRRQHLNISADSGLLSNIGARIGLGCMNPAVVSTFEVPAALEGTKFSVETTSGGGYRLLDPDGAHVLDGQAGRPAVGRVNSSTGAGIVVLKVDSIASCAGTFSLKHIPMDQAVTDLIKQLSIDEVGSQTGIINIALQDTSPDLLVSVLNAIAETNVQQNIDQSAAQAAKQLNFVVTQLPALQNSLEKAQAQLAEFLGTKPTLAALSQSTEYLIAQATAIDQQIGPLQAQVAAARAALGARNPQLQVLNAQLDALQAEREDLLAGIAKLPKDQQTLVRLQTDVTTDQNLYTGLLNQVQTLRIAKAGAVGDVVIVDPALLPSQPVLSKSLIVGASLPIGLFIGIFVAFISRALRHGIENPDDIDERLGLPVLAVLPHSAAQRRLEQQRKAGLGSSTSMILAALENTDLTTEALRSLRTSLQLAMPKTTPRILCFTSLGRHEGKSFLSSNIAYIFAQGGTRVLLVDADMRRGHLHTVFGWPRGNGLANVLRGELAPEAAIRRTEHKNLDVMTTGSLPSDAANLLVEARLDKTMAQLGDLYDLVIMDAPPILAVGDAFVISQHATLNLLVLKYGLHSLGQLRFALKQFSQKQIPIGGCILNDVSSSAQRYAYRGYGYQYQYEYK